MPDRWGVDPDDSIEDLKYQVEPPKWTKGEKAFAFVYFTLLALATVVALLSTNGNLKILC